MRSYTRRRRASQAKPHHARSAHHVPQGTHHAKKSLLPNGQKRLFCWHAVRDSLAYSFRGAKRVLMYSPVFALTSESPTGAFGHDSNPLRLLYQKTGTTAGGTGFLARRKGFEPLTFWSVAMVFPSHRFSSLSKNADISRVFGIALFIASDNFRQFSARLCAKCAPKNRYKTGSLLPFIPRCVILSMALLRERRGAAQRQAVGYTTRKGVRLCQ